MIGATMTEIDLRKIFSHPPQLRTPRLLLRAIAVEDAEDMFDYARSSLVTRYLSWYPHTDLASTKAFLATVKRRYRRGQLFDWAIVHTANEKMIGTVGFVSFSPKQNSAEIGYALHPDYWGQSITPEAVWAVLRFGFVTLGLHRIEARFMVENIRSRRVMEKVGMRFEGVARGSYLRDGQYCDMGVCAILREDFFILESEGKS